MSVPKSKNVVQHTYCSILMCGSIHGWHRAARGAVTPVFEGNESSELLQGL